MHAQLHCYGPGHALELQPCWYLCDQSLWHPRSCSSFVQLAAFLFSAEVQLQTPGWRKSATTQATRQQGRKISCGWLVSEKRIFVTECSPWLERRTSVWEGVGAIAGGCPGISARAHPESSPCFFTPLIVRFTSFYAQAYVHGSKKKEGTRPLHVRFSWWAAPMLGGYQTDFGITWRMLLSITTTPYLK